MSHAPIPPDEDARLAALKKHGILDTPPEAEFDDLTRLAAHICGAPIALVSLVDENRQWFKSKVGLDASETPRDISFCGRAIHGSDIFEIPDAAKDERFHDNPLVVGPPDIRFYAGVPLVTPEGHNLGTLCVIDRVPRRLSGEQRDALGLLGRQVVRLMESRLAETDLKQSEARWRSLFENTEDIVQSIAGDGRLLLVNRAWRETLGYTEAEAMEMNVFDIIHPDCMRHCRDLFGRIMAGEDVGGINVTFRAKDGRPVAVEGRVIVRFDNGRRAATLGIFQDVTERKTTRRALKRFKRTLDQTQDCIFMFRAGDFRFTYVNEGARRMMGYTEAELLGMTPVDITPEYDLARFRRTVQPLLDGTVSSHTFETLHRDKGGRDIPVEIILQMDGQSGAEPCFVAVVRNIQERRNAEMSLKRSEERLRTIFETSNDAIMMLDEKGFVDCNPATLSFFDVPTKEAFCRVHPAQLSPPEQPDGVDSMTAASRRIGEAYSNGSARFEWTHRTLTGRDFPCEVLLQKMTLDGREVLQAVVRDITERVRGREMSEKRTAQESALNRLLRESLTIDSPVGLLERALDIVLEQPFLKLQSRAGAFLSEGPAGPLRLEVSRDLSPELLTLCDSVAFGKCLCGRAAECGETVHASCVDERHEIRFEGMRPHGHYSVPIVGEQGALGVMVFYLPHGAACHEEETGFLRAVADVVAVGLQRIAAERGLKDAAAAAEAANRAKSEFLSRMSHELRTPLNSIVGFSKLLGMARLPEREEKNVRHIREAGDHLLELINEALDISRIEVGRLDLSPEGVAILPLIDEIAGLVEPMARERRIVVSRPADADPDLRAVCDRQRLRQALLNLAANGVKYNRAGGRLDFEVSVTPAERVRIEVRDTGEGIPGDKLRRLFNPFDRLDAERERADVEGTGLGLALSKKLVEAMGGGIDVSSEPGVGSVFAVEIPLAKDTVFLRRPSAETPRTPQETDAGPASPLLTVLYIEDNQENLEMVRQVVELRPRVRLLGAVRGGEGLDQARRHRPDLIFLDYNLPDLNGDEVLRRLREDEAAGDIPVYMLSADAMPGQIERLKELGAADYLTKPLDIARFLAILDAGG